VVIQADPKFAGSRSMQSTRKHGSSTSLPVGSWPSTCGAQGRGGALAVAVRLHIPSQRCLQPSMGPVCSTCPASHSSGGSTLLSPQSAHSCPTLLGLQALLPPAQGGDFCVHMPCSHVPLSQKLPHG